ncbi:TLD-domain-containing protein [Pilobolus umbonatus]|nr:TLD-domain-containing protein [Pilobolus umbonatus]
MPDSLKLNGRRNDTAIVLTEQVARELRPHFPTRYRISHELRLIYSLDQHGTSMSTLYRLTKNKKEPVLLVVKDAENNVFGAYLNEPLKMGPRYYGTGECFLWKCDEEHVKVFPWTGKNEYMILSDADFIAIGGGQGVFGLWINSELDKGYSQPCPTFDNEALSSHPEFECVELEVWAIHL